MFYYSDHVKFTNKLKNRISQYSNFYIQQQDMSLWFIQVLFYKSQEKFYGLFHFNCTYFLLEFSRYFVFVVTKVNGVFSPLYVSNWLLLIFQKAINFLYLPYTALIDDFQLLFLTFVFYFLFDHYTYFYFVVYCTSQNFQNNVNGVRRLIYVFPK